MPLRRPAQIQYLTSLSNGSAIGEGEKAIEWSENMVRDWLMTGMFADEEDKEARANRVTSELGSRALTLSHARHISVEGARNLGLKIVALEADQMLQEAVLTVHHAGIRT